MKGGFVGGTRRGVSDLLPYEKPKQVCCRDLARRYKIALIRDAGYRLCCGRTNQTVGAEVCSYHLDGQVVPPSRELIRAAYPLPPLRGFVRLISICPSTSLREASLYVAVKKYGVIQLRPLPLRTSLIDGRGAMTNNPVFNDLSDG